MREEKLISKIFGIAFVTIASMLGITRILPESLIFSGICKGCRGYTDLTLCSIIKVRNGRYNFA